MEKEKMEQFTEKEALLLLGRSADAIVLVDASANRYQAVIRRGIFEKLIEQEGDYHTLAETLWFHFSRTQEEITKDYKVFIPTFGKFKGKFSRKLKLGFAGEETPHIVQMTVYPAGKERYLFLMDEMDNSEYIREFMTQSKVRAIQNTYLFSMVIDLVQNTTSSLSITEISDETVHAAISYTDWRMMIVNMIGKDDQQLFLERSDPAYLKEHFAPGRTASFDCLMMNLEGKYIWVKLIFSRVRTRYEDDYRFVFMVQDIHENTVKLQNELKTYVELASRDALTGLLNHGSMETEMINALEQRKKQSTAVSAMIFDIDFFKKVNDTYGHSVGDSTLKYFADILKAYAGDANATAGRWGGEEFVLLCYDQGLEEAKRTADRLCREIGCTSFPGVGSLTCSVGVTELAWDDTLTQAFERMDGALYEAKSDGRNCVRCRPA